MLGLQLMCSKLLPIILLEFSPIILLCLAYYSKMVLRRYTCIRNTSFKIVESNKVKPLVLAANFKLYRYDMTALLECLSILYRSFITIIIL